MLKRSPVLTLAASLLCYFGLWLGIPRASFLARATDPLFNAASRCHNFWSIFLLIGALLILSIPTITFMLAQISVIYFFAKQRLNLKGAILWLCGSLAALCIVVALMLSKLHVVARLHRQPTAREIGYIVGMYPPDVLKMLMYAVILLAACSIGYLVSLRIKDRNLLLPVVIFAASIDFWTVMVGPVSTMMKHAPEIVSAVSAPIPKAGTGAFVPAVTMGIGDPLFMALVFAAVHRLGMNGRRNFVFVFVIMTVAMLAVLTDRLPYLPALVALAIAVVAANWREFKLSKQEKISTAIVTVVLLGTLPLIWTILKPHNVAKPKPSAPVSAPK